MIDCEMVLYNNKKQRGDKNGLVIKTKTRKRSKDC